MAFVTEAESNALQEIRQYYRNLDLLKYFF